MAGDALPATQRPYDETPVHTVDLPDTPVRDRNIPASAWIEAPRRIRELGADLGIVRVDYKRRIHGWLLWRAGPPNHADARYRAVDPTDLERGWEFRLFADGTGDGLGPSGAQHTRFRTWKEDLRDHPADG